jgi:ribosomal protein S18 acetylase RimI-like enzyme
MTAKVPVADEAARAFLESHEFRLVDTNLRFERFAGRMSPPSGNCALRFAGPADRDAVTELARRSFVYSRFHQDPWIPKPTANAIKADWAENFFGGRRGDKMVVANVGDQIVGFALLQAAGAGRVAIDLIAVDEAFRRRGIAADMIGFVESQEKPSTIVVGTQVANLSSVRLYEKLGYRLADAQYVFHYHNSALP